MKEKKETIAMSYRVLMLTTGGTFSTERGADGLRALGDGTIFDFPAVAERISNDGFDFQCRCPYKILSENMTVPRLEQLAMELRRLDFDAADGVIVTHGTDTLAYAVDLAAFVLGDVDLPVVFVSADRPPADPRSNGIANFLAALDLIQSEEKGVFAVYRNGDGVVYVHRGGRLRQMDDVHNDFFSQGLRPYGTIRAGRFQRDPREEDRSFGTNNGFPATVLSRNILQIRPYPGLDYSRIDLTDVDAILHGTYHTGMFCAAGGGESLDTLLTATTQRDIDVFLVGGTAAEESYATALKNTDAVTVLKDVAPEAVYVKMLLAYGAGGNAAATYVRSNVLGEFL